MAIDFFMSPGRLVVISILLIIHGTSPAQDSVSVKLNLEKTSFQTGPGYDPRYDVRSDIAIVYGLNSNSDAGVAEWTKNFSLGKNLSDRLDSWKKRGYITHFMTGIAWGEYQAYFNGNFDGKTHYEDGQVDKDGDTLWHHVGVPYVMPTESYLAYFKTIIKAVIDCGVTSIYLEEPEFWSKAGYSESFKKEWQKFYNSPWKPQHESPEATYMSSKLKYYLYYNALKEMFVYAKTYGSSKGLDVKCYVPTHSLINYTSWGIVSPEASLASLPGMDGYIAQVWTGTARTRNYFNGELKERVFENAFLEYGTMISMTAPTKKKIFLLTDPVEDRPRTWDDYKKNYEATFTAKLMYPMVNNYEVMPWPSRIYLGKFKLENNDTPQPISREYATQMQVMVNSLNDMPLSENKISGSHGIAVLLSNSLMFQRYPSFGKDGKELSDLYGIIMPLLKRGIPVETVHMENLGYNPLKDIKILIMTYSNMKPLSPDVHSYLSEWVKNGGVIIFAGRDDDPFQGVTEWWNTNGNTFKAPSEHLFRTLGLNISADQQIYTCGKGTVVVLRNNPNEFVVTPGTDSAFFGIVSTLYKNTAMSGKLQIKNSYFLERGPYDIAAVMDEMEDTSSLHIKGPVIDLYNPELPVLQEKIVYPGGQAFLYNLNRIVDKTVPKVLCSASRITDEQVNSGSYSFIAKSPSLTWNVMRIYLPVAPENMTVTDNNNNELNGVKKQWDAGTNTMLLQFENNPDGIKVLLEW